MKKGISMCLFTLFILVISLNCKEHRGTETIDCIDCSFYPYDCILSFNKVPDLFTEIENQSEIIGFEAFIDIIVPTAYGNYSVLFQSLTSKTNVFIGTKSTILEPKELFNSHRIHYLNEAYLDKNGSEFFSDSPTDTCVFGCKATYQEFQATINDTIYYIFDLSIIIKSRKSKFIIFSYNMEEYYDTKEVWLPYLDIRCNESLF